MGTYLLAALLLLPGPAIREQQGTTTSMDCELGSADACHALATRWAEEEPTDPLRALRWYLEACRLGRRASCHEAAVRTENGWGTPLDVTAALEAYRENCEKGYGPSCRALGELFHWGTSVPRDVFRAVDALESGCKASDAESCWILGDMFLRGEVGFEDAARGKALVERACRGGYLTGCVHAGVVREVSGDARERDPDPGFLVQLQSRDPGIRSYAIERVYDGRAFPRVNRTSKLLPYLARALSDPNSFVLQRALAAIDILGPPADPPAAAALRSLVERAVKDEWSRGLVARALSKYPGSTPALVELLSDSVPLVRMEAAASLGRLGPSAREAVAPLSAALHDSYAPVASWAAIAIFRIDPEAARPAQSILRATAFREKNIDLEAKILAAEALFELGKRRDGMRALERLWDPEDEPAAKLPLLQALERIGPEAAGARSILEDSLEDEAEDVRVAGARAVRTVLPAEAAALLDGIRARERSWAMKVKDVSGSWRRASERRKIEAIEGMEPGKSPARNIPKLLVALEDLRTIERPTMDIPDYISPASASERALAAYGARAVEALVYVLEHQPAPARTGAARTLATIGGRRALDALARDQ